MFVSQVVLATFDKGVLIPDAPLPLPAQARVRLTVEQLNGAEEGADLAWDALERLWDEATIDSGGVRPTRDQLHERS